MDEIKDTERKNNTVIPQEEWLDGPSKAFDKWLFLNHM